MFIDTQQNLFLLHILTISGLNNKIYKIVLCSSTYLKDAFGKKNHFKIENILLTDS